MNIQNIKIAPWISYHSYFTDRPDSRTYISNEKSHQFILLEEQSSDIFSRISSGCTLDELYQYARQIDVADDLEDFLIELQDAELIFLNQDDCHADSALTQPISQGIQEIDEAEGLAFIAEMEKWAWRNGILISVHWDMTYSCNQKCIHCYNRCMENKTTPAADNREETELTTEEAFAMIDDIADMGVFFLTLSGGEATMRKDFFDIISYARSKGLSVAVFSNGLNFNLPFVKRLSTYWPYQVEVSLYSANPRLHDDITQVPGSFEKTLSALKTLNEAGIRTIAKGVLMKHTLRGYEHIKKVGKEQGSNVSYGLTMMGELDGGKKPLELFADNFNELVVLAATEGSPLYQPPLNVSSDKPAPSYNADRGVCSAGKKMLCISPTGKITPCVFLPVEVGDLRKIGLRQVWADALKNKKHDRALTGHERKADLSSIQSLKYRNFKECGTYDYCSYCKEVCLAIGFLNTGDFLATPTMICIQARARKTAADLLQEGYTRNEICLKLGVPVEFGWIKD